MTKTTVRIKRRPPPRAKGQGREQARPVEDDRAGLNRLLAKPPPPKGKGR